MLVTSRSWIITHTKNGFYLTYALFQSNGFLVDECHYTSDSAVVYTYVHVKNCITHSMISDFLTRMQNEQNLKLFEIFGYNSVTIVKKDATLFDHVGLKILYEHHSSGNASFVSCTDGVEGIKRGFFWNADMMSRLKETIKSRNKRIFPFVEEIEKELVESRRKDSTIEFQQYQLAQKETEIETLREQIESFKKYRFACHVIRFRMKSMDSAVKGALLNPDRRHPQFLMPEFFDFSPEAQKDWSNPQSNRY